MHIKEELKNMADRNKVLICLTLCSIIEVLSCSASIEQRNQLLFYFDKIEVSGSVDVFVKKGDKRGKVSIYADSEVIDSVNAKVRQKTLIIDANNSFEVQRRIPFVKIKAVRKFPVEVIVYVEKISEIRLLGQSNLTCNGVKSDGLNLFHASSGNLFIEDVQSNVIKIEHIGSGLVRCKGNLTQRLEAEFKNEGGLDAGDLEIQSAKIIHRGSGQVEINSSNWVDARIFSSGHVFLHSKPEKMVVQQKGSGEITSLFPDQE